MSKHGNSTEAALTRCLCLSVRRAARALGQVYDDAFSRVGITNGQFTLLAQTKLDGPWTISLLARRLRAERTTLTRNIQLLEQKGWLRIVEGPNDRRERLIEITGVGEQALLASMPYWAGTQRALLDGLGATGWARVVSSIELMDRAIVAMTMESPPSRKMRGRRSIEESSDRLPNGERSVMSPAQVRFLREQLCMCTVLRRCARETGRFYDERLRPANLKISQFHVLAAIDAHPDRLLVDLADVLTLDQTTLTRLIQHLTKLGYVEKGLSGRRKGCLALAPLGRAMLQQAVPIWQGVGDETAAQLAPESTDRMHEVMASVSNAATKIVCVQVHSLDIHSGVNGAV